ncbi:hypothetical protein UR08_07045 [Listeria kieliensis]|uniref:Uncharacterized protein n=1 Tax=Listeria kieliensis TaxID=1621700 RepID=A0A3D8TQ16_9LIST|nr:hypothetical protein UR08_07045 [Listeria kieliensis]
MELVIEIRSVLMRYETYYRIFINGELMDASNTKKALEEAGTSYLRRKCILPLKFIEDDEFFSNLKMQRKLKTKMTLISCQSLSIL